MAATRDEGGTFKYAVESAIVVDNTWTGICSPADLQNPDLLSDAPALSDCHVYGIGIRPRLTVVEDSIRSLGDGMFQATWKQQGTGSEATLQFQFPAAADCTMRVRAGGTVVELMNENGSLFTGARSAMMLAALLADPRYGDNADARALLDLEIAYVGQSYGKEGGRAALQRLARHETLQRVLADLSAERPDSEAWVVFLAFDGHSNISTMGPWNSELPLEKSMDHAIASATAAVPMDEVTTLAEAALIRYFQPVYNIRYKDTFPSLEHRTYAMPYDLDVNAVGFQLDMTGALCRAGSSTVPVPPAWSHASIFPLREDSERRAIFDVFSDTPSFVLRRQNR
jgi:hypothetical protein